MASHVPTARDLIDAGLSRSFAHHVMAGTRVCKPTLALWLLDRFDLIVPPIAGKTKREIDLLRTMYPPEAPISIERRREVAQADREAA